MMNASIVRRKPDLIGQRCNGMTITSSLSSNNMSLKENKRPTSFYPMTPESDAGMRRSRSFGGFLNSKNLYNSPLSPVLGEGFKQDATPGVKKSKSTAFSFKKDARLPKVPRPCRTKVIFESVTQGIRDCIRATEEDILLLRDDTDSLGQQLKAAERYLLRLQFHLSKLEELEENYSLQQRLREGVRNMAKAYVSLPSVNRRESLNNVRFGYKECTQTMCAIEAELENMIGVFHCRMKGLVGFARLVPGDTYEVIMTHGEQKWRTRGRIGVTPDAQNWGNDTISVKALLGEVFALKVQERKSIRNVVLGQKNCDTKDLFSSHPQLMTVNINSTGSIKLSIVISWDPLEGAEEGPIYFEPPAKRQMNRKSLFLPNAEESNPVSPSSASFQLHSVEQRSIFSSSSPPPSPKQCSSQESESPQLTLEEAVTSLAAILEDMSGQRPETARLEELVTELENILQDNGSVPSRRSAASLTIESALEAFDFLEHETDIGLGMEPSSASRPVLLSNKPLTLDQIEANCTLSPESTTRTADSGIESLANRLQEERALESSLGSSPEPPSTGNEQVDAALVWHLGYCDRLLENTGRFGPLRCREQYSLERIVEQTKIIQHLIGISAKDNKICDLQQVMSELTRSKELKQLWARCIDQNQLYVTSNRLLTQLERHYRHCIRCDLPARKAFEELLCRISDTSDLPSGIVTLHQTVLYLDKIAKGDISHYFSQLADEIWTSRRIKSGVVDVVLNTLDLFTNSLPPSQTFREITLLLHSRSDVIKAAAVEYIKKVGTNSKLRETMVFTLCEQLEDAQPEARAAACAALSTIKAQDAIKQLVFVSQSDTVDLVQTAAREALYGLGENGRSAFERSQRSTHGFHGFKVLRHVTAL